MHHMQEDNLAYVISPNVCNIVTHAVHHLNGFSHLQFAMCTSRYTVWRMCTSQRLCSPPEVELALCTVGNNGEHLGEAASDRCCLAPALLFCFGFGLTHSCCLCCVIPKEPAGRQLCMSVHSYGYSFTNALSSASPNVRSVSQFFPTQKFPKDI